LDHEPERIKAEMNDLVKMKQYRECTESNMSFFTSPSPVITGLGPAYSLISCHAKYGWCKPDTDLTSQVIKAGIHNVYTVMGPNPLSGFSCVD